MQLDMCATINSDTHLETVQRVLNMKARAILTEDNDCLYSQGTRVEISAKNLRVMDQMPPFAPRYYSLLLFKDIADIKN